MQGRFTLALLCGAVTAGLVAGCSSGEKARTDSAAADSAAMAAPPADSTAAVPAASGGAASLTNDIQEAENAWRIAVGGGDTVELGRITAPDFKIVGSTGAASTMTRATLMKQVSEGMLAADSSSISDLTASGTADSARADLKFYWRVSRNGKPPKPETLNVTDTWVKRDGRWQLASRVEK
jgi:hypothetical protein